MPDGAMIQTEAEAWRRVARQVANGEQMFHHGLLLQVDALPVDGSRRNSMGQRLYEQWSLCDRHSQLAGFEDNDTRVLAALFLALECEDEAKAAKKRGRAR